MKGLKFEPFFVSYALLKTTKIRQPKSTKDAQKNVGWAERAKPNDRNQEIS